jgi:Tfp pilus assembly protein PilX
MERTTKNIVSTLLHETGSTLVVGLLTLILLSLIGVAATTSSRTEVEVAGNDKTAKEAFYAAELGLATGEGVVESMANRVEFEEGTIASGTIRIPSRSRPAPYLTGWRVWRLRRAIPSKSGTICAIVLRSVLARQRASTSLLLRRTAPVEMPSVRRTSGVSTPSVSTNL